MNVSLTPELERLIEKKMKTGRYHTATEVVREALRLLEERDRIDRLRVAEIRREIQRGDAQLARGEALNGEEVFERIRQKSRDRRKSAK